MDNKCKMTKEGIEKTVKRAKEGLEKQIIGYLKKTSQLDEDINTSLKSTKSEVQINKNGNQVKVIFKTFNLEDCCDECNYEFNNIEHEFTIPEEQPGVISKIKSFFKGE